MARAGGVVLDCAGQGGKGSGCVRARGDIGAAATLAARHTIAPAFTLAYLLCGGEWVQAKRRANRHPEILASRLFAP